MIRFDCTRIMMMIECLTPIYLNGGFIAFTIATSIDVRFAFGERGLDRNATKRTFWTDAMFVRIA